LTNQIDIKRTA